MTNKDKPSILQRYSITNIAATMLVLVILVVVLRQLESFLQPLFIAIFFFYIGSPIVKYMKQRKVPSFFANLVPLFLVVLILFLLAWIVGAHIDDLAANFPSYRLRLQAVFQHGLEWFLENLPVAGDKLRNSLSGATVPLGPIQVLINTVVGNFFGFISFGLLVIFFMIFILGEAGSLPKRLEDAYGKKQSSKILQIGQRINGGIIRYVYVKGLASLLVSVLSTIAMVSFRLDLALLWGTLVFFGNFIPYIGSALAVLFPIAIALLQFQSIGAVVALLLILIGCQILVGNILEPRFAGQQLNLSPLVVLLSLTFWGWLWGIVGLVLSIPIMVSVKFILENIPATQDIAIMMSHVSKTEQG